MRELNVYLAGPVREMGRVLRYAERLATTPGINLVDEWWLRHDGDDSKFSWLQQREIAISVAGRLEATCLLWALWPETTSNGTAWEAGYYRHLCPPGILVITGRTSSSCAFTAMADYRDTSDDLGFVEVLRVLRGRQP